MKINRHNYEAFLLDFIEGNLSSSEAGTVQSFLEKNPDIKAEAEDLLSFKFDSDSVEFEDKSLLKKDAQVDIEGISKFERLSVAFLENDITDEERLMLSKMLEGSEAKQNEHQLIQNTRFSPDLQILFPEKLRLKQIKLINAKRVSYFVSSIAAAAAVLISLVLINLNDKNYTGIALSEKDFEYPEVREVVVMQHSVVGEKFVINNTLIENKIVEEELVARTEQNIESIQSKEVRLFENHLAENKISVKGLIIDTESAIATNNFKPEIEVKDYVNNKLHELGIEKKEKEKILLAKAGKSVTKFFGDLFRKKIQIKKIDIEDGRKLYAVRAGSLEFYTNVKDRKNKERKQR